MGKRKAKLKRKNEGTRPYTWHKSLLVGQIAKAIRINGRMDGSTDRLMDGHTLI